MSKGNQNDNPSSAPYNLPYVLKVLSHRLSLLLMLLSFELQVGVTHPVKVRDTSPKHSYSAFTTT
jgi:hypothetical protein